jgi:uroporphyrinogen decarboxylase
MELRRQHCFWDFLRTPALSVELAQQPLRRFELDATIVFSDILVVLEAMGGGVTYDSGGPVLKHPFRGREDLERVRDVQVRRDLSYVGEALGQLAAAVQPELAVFGFVGAPLTLAAYLVEGGPKSNLRGLKAMYYREPDVAAALLDGLADAAAELLLLQIEAGADVVQIFDSWSNYLGPEDYRELALPPLRRVVQKAQAAGVPVVVYHRGSATHLPAVVTTGCDVVSVDASLTLAEARRQLPESMALQGNLDPAELMGPPERIGRRVSAMVEGAGRQGLIINLGQGLTPDIPVAGVEAFVAAARRV